MGVLVLLKIARDFTLSSSLVYLMCSSLCAAEGIVENLELLVWLFETIIGTILITVTAEMLMTEVQYKINCYDGKNFDTFFLLRRMSVLKLYPA